MKLGKSIRRVLYSLLAFWAALTLLTGTPIPTWRLESLNSPIAVNTMTADGLLLEDGRTIRLPLVKRIPADDPLMLAAVEHGIEIADGGKVFGLIWMNRTCWLSVGNDPRLSSSGTGASEGTARSGQASRGVPAGIGCEPPGL